MSSFGSKRIKEKKQFLQKQYVIQKRKNLEKEIEIIENNEVENLVFTSNNYIHLTKIYAYLYNEFWTPTRKVKILGYNIPNFNFPNNFEYISLGKQIGGVENWSTSLRKYIESLTSKYIIWSTEDLFIIENVNLDIYIYLLSMMKNDDSIGRIGLTKDIELTNQCITTKKFEHYDIIMKQDNEPFRIGGIWSLWNREYLLKYLKPNMSPWEFENQSEANYDGYKILGTKRDYVITFCGSINSGPKKTNKDRLNFLKQPLNFNCFNQPNKRLNKIYVSKLKELGFINENIIATVSK